MSGTSTESLHVDWWDDTDSAGTIDQAFNGELIRAAYFGCLAFTADDLLYASRVAYEPIKSRWLKDVHFCTDAEREIRRLLFEPEARNDFAVAVANLSEVKPYFQEADDKRRSELLQLVEEIENTANGLVASFTDGEWFDGRELHEKVVCAARQLRAVTIQLKRERNSLAIVTQNALYFIRQIDEIASSIIRDVDVPSVAVVADAGCGKTHMSIALIENGSWAPQAAKKMRTELETLKDITLSGGRIIDGGTGDIAVKNASITLNKAKESVLIPYMKKCSEWDKPENVFIEYVNSNEQIINIDWEN